MKKIKTVAKKYLSKFCYYFSFVLIYPIFISKKRKEYLKEKIKTLSNYIEIFKQNIVLKQSRLKKIYLEHCESNFMGIKDIFISIIYVEITDKNFIEINDRISQIEKIFYVKKKESKMMENINLEIAPITEENKYISQAYYSLLGKIHKKYKRYPWKHLLNIFNFEKVEIIL